MLLSFMEREQFSPITGISIREPGWAKGLPKYPQGPIQNGVLTKGMPVQASIDKDGADGCTCNCDLEHSTSRDPGRSLISHSSNQCRFNYLQARS